MSANRMLYPIECLSVKQNLTPQILHFQFQMILHHLKALILNTKVTNQVFTMLNINLLVTQTVTKTYIR